MRRVFIGKGAGSACPFHRLVDKIVSPLLEKKPQQNMQSLWDASVQTDPKEVNITIQDNSPTLAKTQIVENLQPDVSEQYNEPPSRVTNPRLAVPTSISFASKVKLDKISRNGAFEVTKLGISSTYPTYLPATKSATYPGMSVDFHSPHGISYSEHTPEHHNHVFRHNLASKSEFRLGELPQIAECRSVQPPSKAAAPRRSGRPQSALINGYSYLEILTTPWLRRLYGHLIGIFDIEEATLVSPVVLHKESSNKAKMEINKRTERARMPILRYKRPNIKELKSATADVSKKATVERRFAEKPKNTGNKLNNVASSPKKEKLAAMRRKFAKEISVLEKRALEINFEKARTKKSGRKDSFYGKAIEDFVKMRRRIEKHLLLRLRRMNQSANGGMSGEKERLAQIKAIKEFLKLLKRKRLVLILLLNDKSRRTPLRYRRGRVHSGGDLRPSSPRLHPRLS